MKLYKVRYKAWNAPGAQLVLFERLSVGNTEREAIENVKSHFGGDGRDYTVEEIRDVMGHDIFVDKEPQKNNWVSCSDSMPPAGKHMRVWMSFRTPWGGTVKRGVWSGRRFEWDNGKAMKDIPDAWQPYKTPRPF